ncbi:MAG: cell division protein ZapA [Candidatus Treponema excrementipullorum]|nr:cell division protein ZapA [Candidatus Treponema excrementipullorum]MDY4707769.1 cell division protein ZapA [Candidatus Treponema excrementipullorum]
MGSVSISLLGTSFKLRAQEDSLHLQRIVDYYSKIVSQVESCVSERDPLKLSILAGIMVIDELFSNNKQSYYTNTDELDEVENITLHLINTINKTLE